MKPIVFTSILTASLFISKSGSALPSFMIERTYYADAEKTEQVGYEIRPCCNASCPPLEGKRTRFSTRERTKCDGGNGPTRSYCLIDGVLTLCPPNICAWYSCDGLPSECWFERPDCSLSGVQVFGMQDSDR